MFPFLGRRSSRALFWLLLCGLSIDRVVSTVNAGPDTDGTGSEDKSQPLMAKINLRHEIVDASVKTLPLNTSQVGLRKDTGDPDVCFLVRFYVSGTLFLRFGVLVHGTEMSTRWVSGNGTVQPTWLVFR